MKVHSLSFSSFVCVINEVGDLGDSYNAFSIFEKPDSYPVRIIVEKSFCKVFL